MTAGPRGLEPTIRTEHGSRRCLPSATGTVITPVAAMQPSPLVDAAGNLFWISGSGQVVENGVVDSQTANVIEMTYVDGVIWQENASHLWWAKTGGPGSYDGWTSGPGTFNSNGTYTPPVSAVPVVRTWVGGGNNEASNPADWNIPTVPAAGDELLFPVEGGTMNVAGNALAGDWVLLDGPEPATAPYTLNLSGHVAMSVGDDFGSVTINLADNSKWIGSFNGGAYGVAEAVVQATGGGSGTFDNTNSTSFSSMIVDANVVGTGIFSVVAGHVSPKLDSCTRSAPASRSISVAGVTATPMALS